MFGYRNWMRFDNSLFSIIMPKTHSVCVCNGETMISGRVLCRYFSVERIRAMSVHTMECLERCLVATKSKLMWPVQWKTCPCSTWNVLNDVCVQKHICFYDRWIIFSGVWNQVKGIQLTNMLNYFAIAWRSNETIELLRSCALQTHFRDYLMFYSFFGLF